tara:strand:- start:256 stop:816 length:561 start_codon:yes stop_codon:yes gene_type:complete
MNNIPGMVISAPMNEVELRNLMFTAFNYYSGPFSIRYPRNRGVLNDWNIPLERIEVGKGRCLAVGNEIAILSIGYAGNFVEEALNQLAMDNIYPGHYDMRFLAPIDEEMLRHIFENYTQIITVEDGSITGGLGTIVAVAKSTHNYTGKLISLGIPDRFIGHGDIETLHKACGYDADSIVITVKSIR